MGSEHSIYGGSDNKFDYQRIFERTFILKKK